MTESITHKNFELNSAIKGYYMDENSKSVLIKIYNGIEVKTREKKGKEKVKKLRIKDILNLCKNKLHLKILINYHFKAMERTQIPLKLDYMRIIIRV